MRRVSIKRRLLQWATFALASAAYGCADGDMGGTSAAQPAPVQATAAGVRGSYPPGVLTGGGDRISGIFPAAAATGECCWTGPDVYFDVRSDARSRVLRLRIYEPPVAQLSGQKLIVVAGAKPVAARAIRPGVQSIVVQLPAAAVTGSRLHIELHMSRSFVPKDAGMNGDRRRLAVMLRSVMAQGS